jgi:signal transduction histidine kinase
MKDVRVPITVNPEIVNVLGEELVSDPLTALSELVKNAYDADADKVILRFPKDHSRIDIEDNGHGMSDGDIRRGWLEIASAKKRRLRDPRSRKRRRLLAGSMGIGRLAAFSLANIIETKTGQKSQPWKAFSLDLKKITRVKDLSNAFVKIETLGTKPRQQGTTITLKELKWWPRDFQEVRVRLAALSSPAGVKDFQIYLSMDDGEEERIELERDLPASPLTIESGVDESGRPTTVIFAKAELYEGSLSRTKWTGHHDDERYQELRGVALKAFWYALGERPGKTYWRIALDTKKAIEDFTGIRIYRDSIRVLPYGQRGDDWLDLERRYVAAGPAARNPRPIQLVGWIMISRTKNPSLGDVANRQGLKEGEGLRQLRQFCRKSFEFLAEVRKEIEPIISRRQELSPEDRPEIEKAVETVRTAISWNPALAERFTLIEKAIDAFFEQSELNALYRDRLTAGLLASIVMHDVGVPLNSATPIIMSAAAEGCEKTSHRNAFQILSAMIPKIKQGYLLLAGAERPEDYRVRSIDASEVVGATVAQMKTVAGSDKVDIQYTPSEPFEVKVRRSDLWAVVTNLIANSIQAAVYEHARKRDFPQERKIVVRVSRQKRDLSIECEDNGPGLPDKPEGWIWEPYNTTKPNGSGLGLYIVSDIVAWYSGSKIATSAKAFGTGALIRVVLPEVVVSD